MTNFETLKKNLRVFSLSLSLGEKRSAKRKTRTNGNRVNLIYIFIRSFYTVAKKMALEFCFSPCRFLNAFYSKIHDNHFEYIYIVCVCVFGRGERKTKSEDDAYYAKWTEESGNSGAKRRGEG